MAALVYSVVLDDGTVAVGGTEETPELRKKITNPLAWGETEPVGDDPAHTSGSEPPRAGRGSGADAWRAYAEGLGLTVEPDAGRDDIVALVDAAR